jgi:DNA-binding GntR family transcriptional regulator
MTSPITIAPRRVLHDELSAALRAMIAEGQLRPGARIPEQTLCAHFGVSRTPLREALKVLSAEGLVRLLPNRGSVVDLLTREEVASMISVLGVLEALAGELACARIEEQASMHIFALHERMVEQFRRGEAEPYVVSNRAIHAAIFQAADNRVLTATHRGVETRLHVLLLLPLKPPPRWGEAVADHERMMKALKARDAGTFALVAREHLRHKADVANEALGRLERQTGKIKHDPFSATSSAEAVNERSRDLPKPDAAVLKS